MKRHSTETAQAKRGFAVVPVRENTTLDGLFDRSVLGTAKSLRCPANENGLSLNLDPPTGRECDPTGDEQNERRDHLRSIPGRRARECDVNGAKRHNLKKKNYAQRRRQRSGSLLEPDSPEDEARSRKQPEMRLVRHRRKQQHQAENHASFERIRNFADALLPAGESNSKEAHKRQDHRDAVNDDLRDLGRRQRRRAVMELQTAWFQSPG